MCDCHSILECCVVFSGVKLNVRSLIYLMEDNIHVKPNTLSLKSELFFISIELC